MKKTEKPAMENKKKTKSSKTGEKPNKTAVAVDKKTHKPEREKAEKEKQNAQKPKKSVALKKLQQKIARKHHPLFRGRFGKRQLRKPSKEKWSKWRKPRGIDIHKRQEDGAWPKTGYRVPKDIRYRHPSGYYALLASNVKEIESIAQKKETAAIISSSVGKKKRKEMLKKAIETGVVVLNR